MGVRKNRAQDHVEKTHALNTETCLLLYGYVCSSLTHLFSPDLFQIILGSQMPQNENFSGLVTADALPFAESLVSKH